MSGQNGSFAIENGQVRRPVEPSTIVPFGDVVVVRPKQHDLKTRAGLHMTPDSKHAQQQARSMGTVLAIGPDVSKTDKVTVPVEIGDEVVVARFVEVQADGIEGETLLLVPAAAVLAKIVRAS